MHDPTLKEEFMREYSEQAYKKVEGDVTRLFPAYIQHSRILIENLFRISSLL